jgi:Tol biopolymer transport system component
MMAPGDRLGPYEIIEPIGAGGMGEVHKARDTRLNRIVAIKKSFSPFNDRFEREAHAVASLNHPGICSLFDVGPNYLVMEYVDGKPLAGPVPLDDALALARQILDALDAAHRKCIVHRDLKPANILVTKTGVKLLDFGLAKVSAQLAADLTTIGGPATSAGVVLGTVQYMSPEQIEARDVDARSDIFAFGLVLYELITGRRAFDGPSHGSVAAAILKDQPLPISNLCPLTPKGIDRIVRTCLEKDPGDRWQSAREVKHALDWVTLEPQGQREEPQSSQRFSRRTRLWQAATAAALLAAGGAAIWANKSAPPAVAEAIRFEVFPPSDAMFETYVGLSPNGQHLAFTATGADGIVRIWIRDLTSLEARVLPGTEGAQSIIWSPDSRHIAFGFSNQLKKIDTLGGPPQIVCRADSPVGSGTWSAEDVILFGSRGGAGGISRVSAAGGAPRKLTVPAPGAGATSFPSLLPGRRFLYYRRGPIEGIYSGSLDASPENQPATPVLVSQHGAAYVRAPNSDAGYLFFVRDQTLMVQSFDERTLGFAGEAIAIDKVATVNGYPAFSASTNGRLAYRTGARSTSQQLTWFDRTGRSTGTIGDTGGHQQVALSPDGKRAAYRDEVGTMAGDLWLVDITRDISEKLTVDRALGGFPVWSPDGQRIVYRSGMLVVQKQASGVSEVEVLLRPSVQKTPTSWSSDGRFLLLTSIGVADTLYDIDVLPLQGERQVVPFLQTRYNESQARFSPDGRWVAYTSDESGRNEVYVRSFTPAGAGGSPPAARSKISKDGGNSPVWRVDGRELFFRSGSGAPMAVEVTLSATSAEPRSPRQLFSTPAVPWDAAGDGKRFLVSMPLPGDVQPPITIDLHWEATLKK